MFDACQDKACATVQVEDDGIAEADESFPIMLERSDTLDSRIELSASVAHLAIIGDNDGKCVFMRNLCLTFKHKHFFLQL